MRRILCAIIALMILLSPSTSFAGLLDPITHLDNDLENTFLSWPGLLLLGGGISALALTQEDQSIQQPFRNGRHLGKADTALNMMGRSYVLDSAALVFYGVSKLAHQEKLAQTGETLVEALLLTEATTLGLKLAFRRRRPDGHVRGFPSGHAARSFAVASALQALHGPAVGVPALLLAGLISFSRLDENKHNASDIIFGAALGAAFGWGTARFHNKFFNDITITPMAGYGPGVMVSKRF